MVEQGFRFQSDASARVGIMQICRQRKAARKKNWLEVFGWGYIAHNVIMNSFSTRD